MQRLNNVFIFFFAFVLGGLIWAGVFLFLEKTPVFFNKVSKDYKYYRIDLAHLFFNTKKKIENVNINNTLSLNSIKLKAVYKRGNGGFIVIEDKGKTVFVDFNSSYNGYKLVKIAKNFAVFEKNKKAYKLEFKNSKKEGNYKFKGETYVKSINKKTFEEYKKDLSKVWRNIGIIKVKKGYKITYIRKNSIFDKIGLKRGDILIEINGKKLINDSDAWEIYKNADKMNYFEIKIKRKDKEKVLSYEVY